MYSALYIHHFTDHSGRERERTVGMINRTLTSEVSRGNGVASSVGGDRDTDHGTQQVRGVLSRVQGVGLLCAVAVCPVQVVIVGLQRNQIKAK